MKITQEEYNKLLKSFQLQLVTVAKWENAYESLEKNFETQKEVIHNLEKKLP